MRIHKQTLGFSGVQTNDKLRRRLDSAARIARLLVLSNMAVMEARSFAAEESWRAKQQAEEPSHLMTNDEPSAQDPADGQPFRRRKRYHGTHPRNYDEKYKELSSSPDPETIAKLIASGKTPAGQHRPILFRSKVTPS